MPFRNYINIKKQEKFVQIKVKSAQVLYNIDPPIW